MSKPVDVEITRGYESFKCIDASELSPVHGEWFGMPWRHHFFNPDESNEEDATAPIPKEKRRKWRGCWCRIESCSTKQILYRRLFFTKHGTVGGNSENETSNTVAFCWDDWIHLTDVDNFESARLSITKMRWFSKWKLFFTQISGESAISRYYAILAVLLALLSIALAVLGFIV